MYDCNYKKLATNDHYLLAEGAIAEGDVTLEDGVSIWHHAVIRGDEGPIYIGKDTNIQDCAVLHAGPMMIGKGCTIGHSAVVHGCTIGDNVLVGMGAVILSGAKIGDNCIIGACALVTGKMDIPSGSMVMGSPAKVVRALTAEEIEGNKASAEEYITFAKNYRAARTDA